MSNEAIISGSLVDVRNVGHEKSVKLTLHVPAELAMKVVEVFGWPTQTDPVPVAIARLTSAEVRREPPRSPQPSPTRSAGAARKPFHELRYPQQAALRSKDPMYWAFLRECCSADAGDVRNDIDAAHAIRQICLVESRADIKPGTEAEKKWLQLENWFDAWTTEDRAFA